MVSTTVVALVLLVTSTASNHTNPCWIEPQGGFVDVPAKTIVIPQRAFKGCHALVSIRLPPSVTSIETEAFSDATALVHVHGASGVKNIEEGAFRDALALHTIGPPVNGSNGGPRVTLPSIVSIGHMAFMGCSSITSIHLGANLTVLSDYAFFFCTSLAAPLQLHHLGDLHHIGAHAFGTCSQLATVTLPQNLLSIGNGSFADCSALHSLGPGIPASVTSIGPNAFSSCTALPWTYVSQDCTVGDNAFFGTGGYDYTWPPLPPSLPTNGMQQGQLEPKLPPLPPSLPTNGMQQGQLEPTLPPYPAQPPIVQLDPSLPPYPSQPPFVPPPPSLPIWQTWGGAPPPPAANASGSINGPQGNAPEVVSQEIADEIVEVQQQLSSLALDETNAQEVSQAALDFIDGALSNAEQAVSDGGGGGDGGNAIGGGNSGGSDATDDQGGAAVDVQVGTAALDFVTEVATSLADHTAAGETVVLATPMVTLAVITAPAPPPNGPSVPMAPPPSLDLATKGAKPRFGRVSLPTSSATPGSGSGSGSGSGDDGVATAVSLYDVDVKGGATDANTSALFAGIVHVERVGSGGSSSGGGRVRRSLTHSTTSTTAGAELVVLFEAPKTARGGGACSSSFFGLLSAYMSDLGDGDCHGGVCCNGACSCGQNFFGAHCEYHVDCAEYDANASAWTYNTCHMTNELLGDFYSGTRTGTTTVTSGEGANATTLEVVECACSSSVGTFTLRASFSAAERWLPDHNVALDGATLALFSRRLWTTWEGWVTLLLTLGVILGCICRAHYLDCRRALVRAPPDWWTPPHGQGWSFMWRWKYQVRMFHPLFQIFFIVGGYSERKRLHATVSFFNYLLCYWTSQMLFFERPTCFLEARVLSQLIAFCFSFVAWFVGAELFKCGYARDAFGILGQERARVLRKADSAHPPDFGHIRTSVRASVALLRTTITSRLGRSSQGGSSQGRGDGEAAEDARRRSETREEMALASSSAAPASTSLIEESDEAAASEAAAREEQLSVAATTPLPLSVRATSASSLGVPIADLAPAATVGGAPAPRLAAPPELVVQVRSERQSSRTRSFSALNAPVSSSSSSSSRGVVAVEAADVIIDDAGGSVADDEVSSREHLSLASATPLPPSERATSASPLVAAPNAAVEEPSYSLIGMRTINQVWTRLMDLNLMSATAREAAAKEAASGDTAAAATASPTSASGTVLSPSKQLRSVMRRTVTPVSGDGGDDGQGSPPPSPPSPTWTLPPPPPQLQTASSLSLSIFSPRGLPGALRAALGGRRSDARRTDLAAARRTDRNSATVGEVTVGAARVVRREAARKRTNREVRAWVPWDRLHRVAGETAAEDFWAVHFVLSDEESAEESAEAAATAKATELPTPPELPLTVPSEPSEAAAERMDKVTPSSRVAVLTIDSIGMHALPSWLVRWWDAAHGDHALIHIRGRDTRDLPRAARAALAEALESQTLASRLEGHGPLSREAPTSLREALRRTPLMALVAWAFNLSVGAVGYFGLLYSILVVFRAEHANEGYIGGFLAHVTVAVALALLGVEVSASAVVASLPCSSKRTYRWLCHLPFLTTRDLVRFSFLGVAAVVTASGAARLGFEASTGTAAATVTASGASPPPPPPPSLPPPLPSLPPPSLPPLD